MKTSDLVYIGIKGSVIALDRATGQQAWATHLKGSGFVNVVVENDQILASTYGEIFCLNPTTGEGLWHNPLRGFGHGLATIATAVSPGLGLAAAVAEQARQDEEAAASGTVASTSVATMYRPETTGNLDQLVGWPELVRQAFVPAPKPLWRCTKIHCWQR